jgi:hypothetical protein
VHSVAFIGTAVYAWTMVLTIIVMPRTSCVLRRQHTICMRDRLGRIVRLTGFAARVGEFGCWKDDGEKPSLS